MKTLMPYDGYRLHQTERAKSPAEVRRADEQAARLAFAAGSLLRGIARPLRAVLRPHSRPRRPVYAARRDWGAEFTGRG